jgi:hypothetical protein
MVVVVLSSALWTGSRTFYRMIILARINVVSAVNLVGCTARDYSPGVGYSRRRWELRIPRIQTAQATTTSVADFEFDAEESVIARPCGNREGRCRRFTRHRDECKEVTSFCLKCIKLFASDKEAQNKHMADGELIKYAPAQQPKQLWRLLSELYWWPPSLAA